MDVLKDFDFSKIMIWIVPGAFIALFRSFALRGSFPSITKDDLATLLLGSVVYNFILISTVSGLTFHFLDSNPGWSFGFWLLILVLVPLLTGFALGIFEAGDYTGNLLRRVGIRFPSPTPTAWETLFKELERGSVLMVTLKDGARVYGRWTGGKRLSSASTDPKIMDIFLAEIGTVSEQGKYLPKTPQRGIYVSASEIRFIEIV